VKFHARSPGALEKRGVGALELVAMDMKTRYGMSFQVFYILQLNGFDYQLVCKQPSFKFSCKLAPLTAPIVDLCVGECTYVGHSVLKELISPSTKYLWKTECRFVTRSLCIQSQLLGLMESK
jgi:hypothetical protein